MESVVPFHQIVCGEVHHLIQSREIHGLDIVACTVDDLLHAIQIIQVALHPHSVERVVVTTVRTEVMVLLLVGRQVVSVSQCEEVLHRVTVLYVVNSQRSRCQVVRTHRQVARVARIETVIGIDPVSARSVDGNDGGRLGSNDITVRVGPVHKGPVVAIVKIQLNLFGLAFHVVEHHRVSLIDVVSLVTRLVECVDGRETRFGCCLHMERNHIRESRNSQQESKCSNK